MEARHASVKKRSGPDLEITDLAAERPALRMMTLNSVLICSYNLATQGRANGLTRSDALASAVRGITILRPMVLVKIA